MVTISKKLLESYQFVVQVPLKSHFQGSVVNGH